MSEGGPHGGDTLVVLARSPVPRLGKSRLRALVGDDAADRLSRAFVSDTLCWARRDAPRVIVAHDGPAAALAGLCDGAELVAQAAVPFGERVCGAVDHAFSAGAGRVVLVGTDSPTLPGRALAACFAALDSVTASLVPAEDGGWVALGTRRPLGRALAGVPWSAPTTGRQTVAALTRSGMAVRVLDPWYDVDDLAGMVRMMAHLDGAGGERAPATRSAVAALGW